MAKKGYDKKINKHQNWGGDKSTGGLPVLGSRVQEFIKEQLENRIGYLYYDATNNRYLAFADEENRDSYVATDDASLVLGTFDAPFNYSAEITLTTPTYNAVFLGSIGNYINFTFDIKNKAGASTGENVYVTYTFVHNATKRVVTEIRRYGEAVHLNIDEYLSEGTNTIIVGISGQNTLAATTVAITYQVVDLQLTDEFDISKAYNLSSGSATMEILWSVKGYGTKVVEWYIDGVLQPFDKVVDEVVAIEGGSPKYITLSALGNGRHNLQMRAYTTINGEKFYTDTLYRDFIVYDGATTTPTIGVALTIPKDFGVVASGSSLVIYDIIQYVPYTFKFATFSPLGEASMNVDVFIGDEKKGSVASKNGVVNEFLFVLNKTGATTLRLVANKATLSIPANVAVTNMNLREITEGLMFDFNANGRNNNASNKDQWSYGEYTATFEGFNWNSTSGWVNNRLRISDGATFSVNFAPLSGSPVALGRTVELEFSTTNVTNDDEVICDLRQNGVGILITATKVLLHSEEGAEIVNEFKENENVRFAFVMNRVSGVTNKGLAFIYTNGIVARCINYSVTDDFASSANIQFSGSSQAQVLLKAIRVYNQALSSDDILNNFTLYRDNVADMMDVYDRNNVYEDGTVTFSPDKMVNRLPVMIVTGDIPTLENTNDKDTQIIVDIEYTNMQDPSKNFTMTQAAMRPQGTSSMGYPKKNFRIYTQKVDGTILKDSQGNVVANKLYAFTDGAQPVDCWCLKADYAESSGTHNTGIARMWHDILMNTQLDGEYVLRTEAQKSAIAANYQYDVRTTIDGFPILLFYRRTATSDLIFIGKYNFNNDKSTESVFGFEGIPNFNNSRMQCWEILNNGNAIALFTDISNFYKTITIGEDTQEGWKFAFESRYPDTKTPITTDLYNFATWMNSVSQSSFATEKWAHMDVYKMAAYYCYLMRFAGADQFVKNAMLTSEDGEHFYFILYDNDTINGLINTGRLAISPSDNRQTKDASGEYVFAGHDSVLWNRLEADSEFMTIVSAIDDAMFSAGLSYENAIHFFDELQAEKWVERVYNQDAQYKYINPYVESGTNNLFMLQGDRAIHRKWFLAKRFALYDSLLVSGAYKSQSMEFKCINNTQAGQTFTVTSGNNMNYGYGINDVPREVGVSLDVNESYDFVTKETVNLGDPIRLYAAPNIKGLDFSKMTARLATMDITKVYTESLGTKLTSLIVGHEDAENTELTTISGLSSAKILEVLDVQGCKGLTSLDLSNQPYLKSLKAKGSSVASVMFAKGAAVEHVEFSSNMKAIVLSELPSLYASNIIIDGGWSNITSINISECPNISNDFSFVWNIFETATPSHCSLIMNNIVWDDVDPDKLMELVKFKDLQLKGYVRINRASDEIINNLIETFGERIFDKSSEFYIQAPDGVFISGATRLLEGETYKYIAAVFSDEDGRLIFSLPVQRQGCSIDAQTGVLTTTENGLDTSDIEVRAVYITNSGQMLDSRYKVTIEKRTYPTEIVIAGKSLIDSEFTEYTLETTPQEITGNYRTEWTIGENATEYIIVDSFDKSGCVIKRIKEGVLETTLTATMIKNVDGSVVKTTTKNVSLVLPGVVLTKSSNAPLQECLYKKGLVAHEDYSEAWELALITSGQLQPGTSASTSIFYSYRNTLTSLDELQYFTGLDKIPSRVFSGMQKLTSVKLPENIKKIEQSAFSSCNKLVNIDIPDVVEEIASFAFDSCSSLVRVKLPNNITTIATRTFKNCTKLTEINIPSSVTNIMMEAFYGCFPNAEPGLIIRDNWVLGFKDDTTITDVTIPENVIGIAANAFGLSESNDEEEKNVVKHFIIPNTVLYLNALSLANCGGTLYLDVCYTPPRAYEAGSNEVGGLLGHSVFTEVTFGNNVTKIPRYVMQASHNLSIGIPASRTIKKIIVSSSVLSIEDYAFYSNYTNPAIEEFILYVNDSLVIGERSLPKVSREVNTIFSFIGSSKDVILQPKSSSGYFTYGSYPKTLIFENITVGQGFASTSSEPDTAISSIIFRGEVGLYPGCFSRSYVEGIDITIPSNVTLFSGQGSFFSGKNINKLTIDTNIPAMTGTYNGLVYQRYSVKELYIGENVKEIGRLGTFPIGKFTFHSLAVIKELQVGSSNDVFANRQVFILGDENEVTEITIDSDNELTEWKFRNWKNLTKVNISEGVTVIPNYTFYGTGIIEIILPKTLKQLGSYVFQYSSLNSVKIQSVFTMSNHSFAVPLQKISVPSLNFWMNEFNDKTMLGSYQSEYDLYFGSELVENITIPEEITELRAYEFCGAKSLKAITLLGNIALIDSYSLEGCVNLKTIYCYAKVAPRCDYAFGSSVSDYTGRNTYNTGENMLYVPQGATGYDTSYWLDPLQNATKCGFTLSATL